MRDAVYKTGMLLLVYAFCCGMTAHADEDTPSPPPRELLFGDLHIHSSWSLDAYASKTIARPRDAYRYAQGKPIQHLSGETIQLAGPPLDFAALTDHAEYLGVVQAALLPGHPLRKQPLIQTWLRDQAGPRGAAFGRIFDTYADRKGLPALRDVSVLGPAWGALVNIANQENRPGEFSALIGFEYTSNPEGQNLHRNVLFRTDKVPALPFSAMDSTNPEDLWRWMDAARGKGIESIAIPHNSNGSNGLMFAGTRHDGSPVDADWIALRSRSEPIAEVYQIKGQSETHPALSPEDEWANFEVVDWRTLDSTRPSQPPGSYVRDALKRGLELEATFGANPYRLGMLGSTDGHNSASPFEESNYSGKIGFRTATPANRLGAASPFAGETEPVLPLEILWSAAGLAAVWAESNTREAIFDALARREVYATSGSRIRLRLVAGWGFERDDQHRDLSTIGVTEGLPMGSVMSPAPTSSSAPTLLIAAQRDPLSADLERAQVVKGWFDGQQVHERVFDVACPGRAQPNPVDHRCTVPWTSPHRTTCAPATGVGSPELRAWWRDPEYDPAKPAFYYVRVLEIPTCRWSTWDAMALRRATVQGVPATIRERAVTSPVWVPASPSSKREKSRNDTLGADDTGRARADADADADAEEILAR